jgi:UrcA family protein
MKRIFMSALLVGAGLCVGGQVAIADDLGEVTVTSKRVVTTKPVGHTASGVPIVYVSMTYGVSTYGLDLRAHSGALELEKRAREAAQAACKELGRLYRDSTPADAECAKEAFKNAKPQIDEAVNQAERS